jgi:hypothetical protein
MNKQVKVIKHPIYYKQEIEGYNNNPLIQALPPLGSDRELLQRVLYIPEVPSNIKDLDTWVRHDYINKISELYSPPVDEILCIARVINSMIKDGYKNRNPLVFTDNNNDFPSCEIGDNNFTDSEYAAIKVISDYSDDLGPNFIPSPTTFSIIGPNGIGKANAVGRVLSLYPQLIFHDELHNNLSSLKQIVYLKIDCPSDCTIESLVANIFVTLDSILVYTNYAYFYGKKKYNSKVLPMLIKKALQEHNLGLLVINKMQYLGNSKNPGKFLDDIISLGNIPIAFIGTNEVLKLFENDFERLRFLGTNGNLTWNRMRLYNNDNSLNRDWVVFLQNLWKCQYVLNPVKLDDNFIRLFYECTQGITALVISLFKIVQDMALNNGEMITPALILEASQRLPVKPIFDAIKKELSERTATPAIMAQNYQTQEVVSTGLSQQNTYLPQDEIIKKKSKKESKNLDNPKDLRVIYDNALKTKTDIVIAIEQAGYIQNYKDVLTF